MELEKFVSNFAEQFDDTNPAEIQENTCFQELDEWSSLTTMAIIAFVRVDYTKTVTGKEIRSCDTVKDLYELVKSKCE